MDALFDRLIADSLERALPSPTQRDVTLPGLPGKIDVVVGMRRTGKTWFLFQHMAELLGAGVPREALLYLNFEDERWLPLTTADLGRVPDAFFRRQPGLRERTCHFLLDEIQGVPGWERFVRRLLDTENVQLTLTGSSARLLGREIATELRGRALACEVFPFSFREALRHEGLEAPTQPPGAKARALLENRLERYLRAGGFPEVQGVEPELAARILQDYLDAVILRDVVERHGVASVSALRALIRHAMNAPATLFSVNRFYNDLRSQGVACGKNTLHELLAHLEDAYLLFPVPIHARSERTRQVNPRKLYAVDTGLVQACRRQAVPDRGHLLENAVFVHLRRQGLELAYYRTSSGREVDFVVTPRTGAPSLVQVSADLSEAATREREVAALREAMTETGLGEAVLVTQGEAGMNEIREPGVRVVVAWQWLLEDGR
jgi:predicted AAA+ superfamily ATPase